MKWSILVAAAIGLAFGLTYCSFGPDPYVGPWPPDPTPENDGGSTDGADPTGGGASDDGGLHR